MKKIALILIASLPLSACIPAYKLVKPGAVAVGDGSLSVTAKSSWNAVPQPGKRPWEQSWTLNGPLLDSVTFVSGMPAGQSLVKQRRKADAQVAVFRTDMSPTDLVSMIETAYRVGGVTVYDVDSVDPVPFLGDTGVKLRYHYTPGDGISKKGSCVMRVVDGKLYLMKLEGVTSHYFAAAESEFDGMVATAKAGK
jgi:hypothetical protein